MYINREKCFAFVELNSIELTSACMSLDGIQFTHRLGTSVVRVRRPNDYKPELVPVASRTVPSLDLSALGIIGTTVADGPNKVFVGGLPYSLTEEQVKELLTTFGPLRAFHLVKDAGQTNSKGYGFCEYLDPSVTPSVVAGLNGMRIGDKTLSVRVAANPSAASAAIAAATAFQMPSMSSFALPVNVR